MGGALQELVPSLLPHILHMAMQTRGCQALRRQWLPCAPAQGVGPWYGLQLRELGGRGGHCVACSSAHGANTGSRLC